MAYGEFVQIQSNGGKTLWTRLALGDTGGRDEAWLRDLLQSDPRLIPVGELDPSFGPLIPVCTELKTPAGPIDDRKHIRDAAAYRRLCSARKTSERGYA